MANDDAALIYARAQLVDLEGHVQAIIARLVVYVPVLLDLNEDLKTEMTNWLRQLSAAVMEVLVTGADFDTLGPMLVNLGRRRKSLGIDQAQTMASSRHGQQALHDHARDYFRGHPNESEMMAQIVPRLLEYQHVMTLSVARGYASGPPLDDTADRQGRLQHLLEVLLGRHGRPSRAEIGAMAAELGIQLPLTMLSVSTVAGAAARSTAGTIAGAAAGTTAGTTARAADETAVADHVRAVARMNHWAVVGIADGRLVALTMRRPNAFPAPSGIASLAEDAGPDQITTAIARAAAAADVAERLHVNEMNAVDAAPFAAVLALPESDRSAFVHNCFGSLPDTARGMSLLSAVAASITSGRLADAALSLHIHRHTLDYRLKRFSEQTGLDLNDTVARLRIMCALFLLGMLPEG